MRTVIVASKSQAIARIPCRRNMITDCGFRSAIAAVDSSGASPIGRTPISKLLKDAALRRRFRQEPDDEKNPAKNSEHRVRLAEIAGPENLTYSNHETTSARTFERAKSAQQSREQHVNNRQ